MRASMAWALKARGAAVVALAAVAAVLAGCGGGGGGSAAANPPPQTPPPGSPMQSVTVTGRVTFDFVPVSSQGLTYTATQARPARGVAVELVSGTSVLATAITDQDGRYSLAAPGGTQAELRARAEMIRTGSPTWDVRVVDNTASDALYVLQGTPFDTGSVDLVRDLHAASGWDAATSSYASPRSAAPFAVLDVVYDAMEFVLDGAPPLDFPPLTVRWSPDNVPSDTFAPDEGKIFSSLFIPGFGIYLVGAEGDDTDEYDRHVIAHEWGHYFEHSFSRADSIGGPHALDDLLDLRVAFGEGWGNAFSAMVTGESVYRDAHGPRQSRAFGFNIEGSLAVAPLQPPNPGWYNERSVHEILYDLYDAAEDLARGTTPDTIALGFAPLFSVLTGAQRNSAALTSLFSFIHYLKALPSLSDAERAAIDALLGAYDIEPVLGPYGDTEDNGGPSPTTDTLPVYRAIAVGGPVVNVCSTDQHTSSVSDAVNKLGSRQFLKFTVGTAGTHTFTARTTLAPSGAATDPDMILHQQGRVPLPPGPGPVPQPPLGEGPPSASCTADTLDECTESFAWPLVPGDYVLEIYEWTNTNRKDEEDETHRPIGRACFDVRITGP